MALRQEHPAWGGRKIARRLVDWVTPKCPGQHRNVYNHERPHEALGMMCRAALPGSPRTYPSSLPESNIRSTDTVVVVKHNGEAVVHGHKIRCQTPC